MAESQAPEIEKEPPRLLLTTQFELKASDEERKPLLEQRTVKKELDQTRPRTSRVNIGAAFPRWRELREQKGFGNDAQFATFLLDW